MSPLPLSKMRRMRGCDSRGYRTAQIGPAPMRPATLIVCAIIAFFTARAPAAAAAARLPEIRMHRQNGVPACVTPDRLMAFLKMRNGQLPPRYGEIAKWYRHHGEAWRVRWDFAFFQMALETNFLSYRRANGEPGDVRPEQNNFAGIGATGGGVPGDHFADVSTGVLAQIQHLVAYSGEPVERPVAARTKLKQYDIVSVMQRLNRPPRFSDLARRWAADARYASSIALIAESYQRTFCERSINESAAGAGTQSSLQPPAPSAAAKARGKLIARTIWRRGESLPVVALAAAPLPKPAQPSSLPGDAAVSRKDAENRMLSGLQDMARSMGQNVSQWPQDPEAAPPIIAPAPKLAERIPRLAAR